MDKQIRIADPAPLGLAGFGITTCILSLINAGVVSGAALGAVLGLALAYGGGAQLLAGMWEFRKGNTFGATAFSSYGAFWIAFYFIVKAAPSETGVALFLLFFGILTFYLMIGSLYLNRITFLVFLFLTVTFLLLAFGDFGWGTGKAGGWFGLLTGLLALYGSAAGVINATAGKEVLPTGKPLAQAAVTA